MAYYPRGNLWAKTAFKTTKRILRDNIAPDGLLDTPQVMCALLEYRNTKDRDFKISPAELLFGRALHGGIETDKSHLKVHPSHILTAELREQAMVHKSLQIEKNLSTRTTELPPLKVGTW